MAWNLDNAEQQVIVKKKLTGQGPTPKMQDKITNLK